MRFERVLLLAVGLVAVVAVQGDGVARQASSAADVESTQGAVVGASIAHPANWTVERERYTFRRHLRLYPLEAGTGRLQGPRRDPGRARGPGRRAAARSSPRRGRADARLLREPGAGRGARDRQRRRWRARGVAFGPIPGSTPATRVYVPVDGRVYRVDVYSEAPGEEGLDADDRRLLQDGAFRAALRVRRLPRAAARERPEALYPADADEPRMQDRGWTTASSAADAEPGSVEYSASATGERRIVGGCWRANPAFWVQAQHGPAANADKDDGIPTGWTRVGVPNFWGQYTHGDLGYGRCHKPYYANDKFAVDYPMDKGDPIWSPFDCGRVTFAGRNKTHVDYGILVSIESCNGKYVSLTSHFSALRSGLGKGDRVGKNTVLGYAGKYRRRPYSRRPGPLPPGLLPLSETEPRRLPVRGPGLADHPPPLRRHGGPR